MNHKRTLQRISLLFIGTVLSLSPLRAEEGASAEETTSEEIVLSPQAELGMSYFQGGERFENGGPACVTCHNVNNDGVIPGGLFAKDLTDVYERLGEGITGWLGAPPFPAMADSYSNNPLTEEERMSLTAFFKYALDSKDSQENGGGFLWLDGGQTYMIIFGGAGLVGLLIMVQILWSNRKKKMVKKDIFARQSKAWDAKF